MILPSRVRRGFYPILTSMNYSYIKKLGKKKKISCKIEGFVEIQGPFGFSIDVQTFLIFRIMVP